MKSSGMHWKTSIWLLLVVACTQRQESEKETAPQADIGKYHSTRHLIEVEELKAQLGKPGLKVIDFRKKENIDSQHISGAINLWRSDMESNKYPYGGMTAEKSNIETLLGRHGIQSDDNLVVYDGVGSCDAARFWWVMKSLGHDKVKILNGGLNAWKKINGPMDSSKPIFIPTNFRFNSSPQSTSITDEALLSNITSTSNFLLLDTRSTDEYSGKRQKKGATSGGRIPGAIQVEWVENVNFDETGKFKPYEQLGTIYDSLILSQDQEIVTYCQTGVRSSLTYFVLTELLGYENVKNYDGSWSEWSYKEFPKIQDSVTVVME